MSTSTASIGAAFAEHTVSAAGFDVRYWEAGSGTTLVCLPGAGGPSINRALDLLAEQYRVILLELPGWGSQPNDALDAATLAAQTAEVIEALGLGTYHLLGTSMGGIVALHVALDHPDRVVSLTLEAPGLLRAESRHPSTLAPAEFVKAFRTHPEREPHMSPPDPEFMGRVWPLVERVMGPGEADEALLARMREMPTRTLVLWGRNDGIINPVNAPTYRRTLPNCVVFYVYDAAHDIQCDRPEAFADVVADFVRRGMNFLVNNTDRLINP